MQWHLMAYLSVYMQYSPHKIEHSFVSRIMNLEWNYAIIQTPLHAVGRKNTSKQNKGEGATNLLPQVFFSLAIHSYAFAYLIMWRHYWSTIRHHVVTFFPKAFCNGFKGSTTELFVFQPKRVKPSAPQSKPFSA